ncbi:hypothetical protein AGMMS50256_35120 [Betaproteobacteria bacterium]|nr:hypothetical protein AGMMS50256_35120 [Betaproteobacteria bacterium]
MIVTLVAVIFVMAVTVPWLIEPESFYRAIYSMVYSILPSNTNVSQGNASASSSQASASLGIASASSANAIVSLSKASVSPGEILNDPELRQAAENGDPVAQFRLGRALFQDPAHTDKTSALAVRWLEAAAEGGNIDAMIYLGRVFQTGVGILQNFSQASRWINTAAMRGSIEGMLEMGLLYRDGVGVQKDYVKAYAWLNRAAAARNIDAVREREAIAHMLTPDELKEAQRQSSLLGHENDESRTKNAQVNK